MEHSGSALDLAKGHKATSSLATLPELGSFATITPASTTSPSTPPRDQSSQSLSAALLLPISPTSTLTPSPPSSPSPPFILNIVYPLLPSLEPHERLHFHKGAQIALENILEVHLENPEMSLLEVVADMEDLRPVVGVVKEDRERRRVVEGARWAEEAVEAWWIAWFVGDDSESDYESESEVMGEVVDDVIRGDGGQPVVSPLDKDGNVASMHDEEAGASEVGEGGGSYRNERNQDEKEARVVACMLSLLGRWIELQIEHTSKSR